MAAARPGYKPLGAARARPTLANLLLADTSTLDRRVQKLEYTADQIANGSRGLLEEVATGKVTGEEEYWSRTDLWDFQANVDGARVAFEGLRAARRAAETPTLADHDREASSPTSRSCWTRSEKADGFVSYDELTPAEVKELSDAVNALSEPLSRLTAVVVGARSQS